MPQVEVIQTPEGVYFEDTTGDGCSALLEVPCQWFALCTRHAATTRQHPTLGDVPICARCNDKIEGLSK